MIFRSTKLFDGYSTAFRQWKADSHCRFLHGYALTIKITFEGDLDEKNWVQDFGGFKKSLPQLGNMSIKEWLDRVFDHTTVVADDDPDKKEFEALHHKGIIQLRLLPATGVERFAEFIFSSLSPAIRSESNGRVRITQVEVAENNKNSAIYGN